MRREWIVSTFAALCAAWVLQGQPIIASGEPDGADGAPAPCSWLLVRLPFHSSDKGMVDDAQVLLVPPVGVDGAERTPGVVRLMRILDNWPDAVSASGNRLTTAVGGRRAPVAGMETPPGKTEVMSLAAVLEGGRWRTNPDGGFDQSPSLPNGVTVHAMTHVGSDLFAIIGDGPDSPGAGVRAVLLHAGRWEDIALPAGIAPPAEAEVYSVGSRGGVTLLQRDVASGRGVRIWQGAIRPGQVVRQSGKVGGDRDDEDDDFSATSNPRREPSVVAWTDIAPPALDKLPAEPAGIAATCVDGQLVLAVGTEGGTVLMAGTLPGIERETQWRQLGTVRGAAGEVAIAPLAAVGRVVVFWSDPAAPVGADSRTSAIDALKFAEVSVATGRLMAEGDVELAGPAAKSDYRAVGLLLTWVVGLVAIIVIRPRDEAGVHLPESTSFAEPARRMMAGTIDLIICLVAAGLILGRSPLDVLGTSATGLLTSTAGQALLVLTVGIGAVLGTVSEATTGRTMGKAMCGCFVADLRGTGKAGVSRLALGRALLRNLVKWCLPPAGLIGVMSSSARHRGDEYAGAGVLMAAPPDEEELDM